MENEERAGLSDEDLAAEDAVALPDKEVVSILDLNADLDLAIDAAAPIDLGVAANANVAAPIDAAVGANLLSEGSTAQALSDQGVAITQDVNADAVANASQDSTLEQGAVGSTSPEQPQSMVGSTAPDAPEGAVGSTVPGDSLPGDLPGDLDGGVPGEVPTEIPTEVPEPDLSSLSDGNLLNVNVDLDGDANIAAPINGAVAANANVAAPIDAAVAANVGSIGSEAVAVSQQDAIINQSIDGSAEATAGQESEISQPDQPQP